jgi:hypothetical protein
VQLLSPQLLNGSSCSQLPGRGEVVEFAISSVAEKDIEKETSELAKENEEKKTTKSEDVVLTFKPEVPVTKLEQTKKAVSDSDKVSGSVKSEERTLPKSEIAQKSINNNRQIFNAAKSAPVQEEEQPPLEVVQRTLGLWFTASSFKFLFRHHAEDVEDEESLR